MQVGVDIKCMHTSFGGCGFFAFGVLPFKNGQISLLKAWTIYSSCYYSPTIVMVIKKFNGAELAQKIHTSRC